MVQLTERNAVLEAAAKIAEAWVPFVEGKHARGECDTDEMRTSRATALTIAMKIREQQS